MNKGIVVVLLLLSVIVSGQDLNTELGNYGNNLKAETPKVVWPKQFTMGATTDTLIYNTTMRFKFDSAGNRIWTQVNYTSVLFGNFEAFQMSIFANDKNVSLKIDDECKWGNVYEVAYIYLNLIFNSWSYYTKYNGRTEEGLHIFQLIDYVQPSKNAKVVFLFADSKESDHVELSQIAINSSSYDHPISLKIVEKVTESSFTDKDFHFGSVKCENVSSEKVGKFRDAIAKVSIPLSISV